MHREKNNQNKALTISVVNVVFVVLTLLWQEWCI